jgi:hypothetical protein
MRRLSGLPDKTGLRVVGVDFQRGEQESLATRFVTAALGLDSYEYRIDLGQGSWIITF